ncbi:MAG: rhomboid family intramembrane serine protease [Propionibacteriaceae bacterium]|jgi:membrane associated rhomboid family serine protease|nr:rhomboid family intramembrane serine protease [Propionibacteriaceae bacterium]
MAGFEPGRCYAHPDRETRIVCRRCGRPICADCMVPAAVGFQCRDCVRQFARQTRQGQGPYGGRLSDNPALTTVVLIGINVAVWVLIQATGGQWSRWSELFGLSPLGRCGVATDPSLYYPSLDQAACLARAGTVWQPGVASGAVWQLLTSVFTHVEWLHIGCNMLTLWFLGPPLERILGRARWLALYLLSGLGGSVCVLWLSQPASSVVGASGAIFGLLASLLLIMRRLHQDLRQVLLWLGLNVVITLVARDSISWQGHLGGFLIGAAVSAILVFMPARQRSRRQWLALGGVALVLVGLTVARCLMLA